MGIDDLPALNAVLNGTAAALIVAGRVQARRRNVAAHRALMLAAVACSTLFLASYLVYHARHGVTTFGAGGWPKALYLGVLFTHTPLAAVLLPLIGTSLWHALRGNVEAHRRVVRWTFPIWLYVSVTGVLIYLMLHRIPW